MQTNTDIPKRDRLRLDSPIGRLLILGVLILVLLIPAGKIQGVVGERQASRSQAVTDIEGKWGGSQTLMGPVLRVPFVTRSVGTSATGKPIEVITADTAYLLPRHLNISGQADTEIRSRGIFDVPVYTATLQLEGDFERPDFASWGVKKSDVDWKRAELMVGLSQPRALHADASLAWNSKQLRFKPSTGQSGHWNPAGIHAAIGSEIPDLFPGTSAKFAVTVKFNGADSFSVAPTAEETQLSFRSNWPHPSFQGSWLPVERSVDEKGFSARWSVSYLGRDYPQRWRDTVTSAEAVAKSNFGFRLANPVDNYSMADRITKYALMTMVFTFSVIWLTEILSGARSHPIQYGFIGSALCLFGLLQLTFAEHFGFTAAFVVAAIAVTVLVTLYSYSVLKSVKRAAAVCSVQTALYGYLYTILRAEDYALLGGAIALFAGLALTMYLTRRIDWFELSSRPVPEKSK